MNPQKGVKVMVDLSRGEGVAAGKTFPLALALGTDSYKVEMHLGAHSLVWRSGKMCLLVRISRTKDFVCFM